MSVPDGWQEWDPCASNPNRPVACGDCSWEGFENDVEESVWEIRKIAERVGSGEIMPVGTCPEIHMCSKDGESVCRALVHYTDVEVIYRKTPNVLDLIVEAVEAAE